MNDIASKMCWVYITCSGETEARKIGRYLLEQRLAGCVNVLGPVASMYWWEGEIQEDQECVLVAKSQAKHFAALKDAVCEVHSYSCPCVVALPVIAGHQPFLDWLAKETPYPDAGASR